MTTDDIRDVQAVLGLSIDGVAGPATWAAIHAKICGRDVPASSLDPHSAKNIPTLLPPVQKLALALIEKAAQAGIALRVTSGTRTYAEQDALFAKGGVTKARGGQSNHNFGLAFDVTIWTRHWSEHQTGDPVWESPLYAKLGAMGKQLGLSWGGDWQSFKDEPHFEFRPKWAAGFNESDMLAELRNRHNAGSDFLA